MKTCSLIACFAHRDDARAAIKILYKKGFNRAAWVNKSEEGGQRTWDPFPVRRIMGALAAFLLFGCLAVAGSTAAGFASFWVPALSGGVFGALLGLGWIRRSTHGVERVLIENNARWLNVGETVLIVQARIEKMRIPLALLREIGDIPPAVFVLQYKREGPIGEAWIPGLPLSPTFLQEHARRLALEHQLDPKPLRNTILLKRLQQGCRWVQRVCLDLTEAGGLEQSVPPTTEWLLDNVYILESNARDVLLNLPKHYYRQLPGLANEPYRGLPRIYAMAREIVTHTDLRVDQENILAFIESYQSTATLSIGELWAVPQMLRAVLIEGIQQLAGRALSELCEREVADLWANRLVTSNRRDPNLLFSLMADLTGTYSKPSPYFATQLADFLYDEGAALAPVQSWLERTFQKDMNDLIMKERNRQTRDQISIGNAFTSLRQLGLIDWKECFERLSRVDRTLRKDPAGIYHQMDFNSRDRYRRAVESLRRGSGLAEDAIAQQAIDLASRPEHADENDERTSHVGTYLIGTKRVDLARLVGCRETFRFRALHWAQRHHTSVYLVGLFFFSSLFVALSLHLGLRGQSVGIHLWVALLLLIPTSQLALEVMNYLITRFFPPRSLAKMDFEISGIPDACRTLVIVPMLLLDRKTIKAEAEKLEIRYLANKEANLFFALYSDYKDAPQLHCEADAALLHTAIECVESLNLRHGGQRFFLLHRERKWCESEKIFMGWERKRGKLEELNALIVGARPREAERLVYVGDPDQLANIRFVITLDSDTQLPHDTARRLIETLSHPLNQPRFDGSGHVMAGSYTIIQPRVSPSLPSSTNSPFSRLFSDPVGLDPYSNAVSDVYQDLTGEGSYHGKGIYDVRAFSRVLSGRFPEGHLLSHDLIEGAHVRVGLASDIELYDEFPQDYPSYIKRQHRWIRGDWQIAAWLLPNVPLSGGGRGPNPLSWFDRWKIFDNLRRSLLPATSLALLLVCWLISSPAGWIASFVVATQLLFHSLAQPLTWATTGQDLKQISLARIAHDLRRVLVEAALLPYQTWLSLDAIVRVIYRKNISHRGMLEWSSAQAVHGNSRANTRAFIYSMGVASLFSVIVGWTVLLARPEHLLMASPWLLLWFLSLMIGWHLSHRPLTVKPVSLLPEKDRLFMRNVARRTWRYFSDFVNEETSWLPPDNYQVSHQNRLAMRTSPTNIGLYLASALTAHDFGYLTIDGLSHLLTRSMATIEKLERHEGHLLNWYDIKTLEPLNPRYVSTVDSGNLLGSLWTLTQGLDVLVRVPLLGAQVFSGLHDAGDVLRQVIREDKSSHLDAHALDGLMDTWESPPAGAQDVLNYLRKSEPILRELAEAAMPSPAGNANVAYWAGQILSQLKSWLNIGERYLSWIDILAEVSEDDLDRLDPDILPVFHQAMHDAPSLKDLADGRIPCMSALQSIRKNASEGGRELQDWVERVLAAFERSQWLAGEMLAMVAGLSLSSRELTRSVNMHFLYNTERRLFSIGYNVSEGRLDRAFYDLLASEARMGSFVAIARGDSPAEHWFVLGRPYGAIGRSRTLRRLRLAYGGRELFGVRARGAKRAARCALSAEARDRRARSRSGSR